MRILLINPNTSTGVTDLVTTHVRAIARDIQADAQFTPVTGRFGARYISSRAAAAIAGHAALDAYASQSSSHSADHGADFDAVYLACFGDPGLLALREIARIPVVGMAEAACLEACRRGKRFAIVTGGALWKPMLTEFVITMGLAEKFAGVRTIVLTGGQIARDPDAALADLAQACRDCAQDDGADAVILGGAALAGLAARIQPDVPAPVICSVEAGTRAVIAAAMQPAPAREPPPSVESTGLGDDLARLLNAPPG